MIEGSSGGKASKIFSFIPLPKLHTYTVIAEPEGKGKGFWAGGGRRLFTQNQPISMPKLFFFLGGGSGRPSGNIICIMLAKIG